MQQQIVEAIQHLKDAAAQDQVNKKLARAHVVQAANILNTLLRLPTADPDPDPGSQTTKELDPEGPTGG